MVRPRGHNNSNVVLSMLVSVTVKGWSHSPWMPAWQWQQQMTQTDFTTHQARLTATRLCTCQQKAGLHVHTMAAAGSACQQQPHDVLAQMYCLHHQIPTMAVASWQLDASQMHQLTCGASHQRSLLALRGHHVQASIRLVPGRRYFADCLQMLIN